MDMNKNKNEETKIEEKIILNGKEVSKEEFEQKKRELKEQKGVEITQINTTEYKTRLKD